MSETSGIVGVPTKTFEEMRTKSIPPPTPSARRAMHVNDDSGNPPAVPADDPCSSGDENASPPGSPSAKRHPGSPRAKRHNSSKNEVCNPSKHKDQTDSSKGNKALAQDHYSQHLDYKSFASKFDSERDLPLSRGVERSREVNSLAIIGCIVGIVLFSASSLYPFSASSLYPFSDTSTDTNAVDELQKEVSNLEGEFPAQVNDMWFSFVTGINRTISEEPNAPSSFLLLDEFSSKVSECLARKVGKAAAKFLNSEEKEPIIVDGFTLKNNNSLLEDHGRFTATYKPDVESIGVMIVNNLQEIPGTIAQTFHTFCDEYNPLVGKAVYFFTLKVSNWNEKNPIKLAEETLANIWKDQLDDDAIQPLITRMTSEVFIVQPESGTPCEN